MCKSPRDVEKGKNILNFCTPIYYYFILYVSINQNNI